MPAPLRLLMTTDTMGGVWTYAVELARAFAGSGVELALAIMGALPSAGQRAELASLPGVTLFTSEYRLEWMEEPWAEVDAAGRWLQRLVAEWQPTLLHLNGYAHAALPWPVPVLVVAHSCVLSWWSAVKGEAAPARYQEYRRRLEHGLAGADLVVAPTEAMGRELAQHYRFHAPVRIIPNGRTPEGFRAAAKEPFIFSAGRLWDEAKNVSLLAGLAPRLLWPVRLAGPDAPTALSEGGSAPASAPASPACLGRLSPAELAARLAEAAIYASPARYEPFGLGILEAAFSGCTLVLSDLPSLREIWAGAALFLPALDEEAWVHTLNRLAVAGEERTALAHRARERARRYSARRCAELYLAAYGELLATAGSRRASSPALALSA